MNDIERKIFWDTLCSLDGKNIEDDINKLNATIIYPQKLYRYRPVTTSTLEALNSNKLYFSTANYYDDPFDTFINIRIKDIRSAILNIETAKETDLEKYVKVLAREFGRTDVNSENVSIIVRQIKEMMSREDSANALEAYFRNIRNEIKKDTFSVCFTESPFNETLWLKYAEQHKGFAVEYDLTDHQKFLCGKQEKCRNCGVNAYGSPLYPIYYSEEMYDATKFAQFLSACKQLGSNLNQDYLGKIENLFGAQVWEREKISLIKKDCHKYDEEWRMILLGQMQAPVMREWIPSAIYLGLNMKPSEMRLISEIAKNAGVEKIYRCCISDEGKLEALLQ